MLQAVDDTRGCFPPTNGRLLPSRHPKAAAARGKRRAGLHDVFPELCHPYSPMVKAENGVTTNMIKYVIIYYYIIIFIYYIIISIYIIIFFVELLELYINIAIYDHI